ISMNSPGYRLANTVIQYALEIEDDYAVTKNDFVDYKNGNLNLKEDSAVFKNVPEFQAIDFDAIGAQEKPAEEKTYEDVLTNSVVLKVNVPKTLVFGNESTVDPNNSEVYAFIDNSRTLVPVRFIAESFGGTVDWDADTRKVTVTSEGINVEMYIDQTEMTVNGETVALDVPAKIVNSRTMLPLRAVVEALGKTVHWDNRGLIVLSETPVIAEDDATFVDALLAEF
ncbi:MAG: copper amine oxidase N-terminal domain-containing protein, partial [Ruminococcaceae bacterium]|nr:copper amine oxidase N-terminal domain-containing protein [Oscillospiraceae bacterium]